MKEFLSVNEFSKYSGIEKTTLRYWDEIGLLSPAKRDPNNNYRCYLPDQLIAVHFVTVLSELNIPLKMIDSLKNKRNPQSVIQLIEHQEKLLDQEMRRLQERYSVIHERRASIREGIRAMNLEPGIHVTYLEEMAGVLGPLNEFNDGEDFHDSFSRFCHLAEEMRINLNYQIAGFHETPESFLDTPGRPDRYISLDPSGNYKRPAGDYLVAYSRGYYGQYGDLPERIRSFAAENALTLSGPVFSTYLLDEICLDDPSRYLVQVCIAASERRDV